MQDSATQVDTDAGEADPSTGLVERLLRRRTEPLGVIDVRQPQQQYERTAGWVAQRFALLDHWKTRYGSDEDAAAANASLVFAAPGQPKAELSGALSSHTQLARAAKQAVVSQPSAASVASSSPTEQFRVRRRAEAPTSSPQIAALPQSGLSSAAQADDATTIAHNSISSETAARFQSERGQLRAAEIPMSAHQSAPTPSALILPKRLAGSGEAEPETAGDAARSVKRSGQREITSLLSASAAQTPTENLTKNTSSSLHRGEMPVSTAVAPTQSPVNVSRVEASSSSLTLRLQRKHNE